ncbi:MAG: hypothetical protein ACO2OR_02395 [Desulfurococcaceae archaeon]
MKRTTLFAALLVLAVLGVVYAAAFAHRYIVGTVNTAPPVVYYADPGTPGVNVTLYNQGTRAIVNASVPPPTIQLVQRNAIFYDTFDTNPITGGRLQAITCTWTWNSALRAIQISAGSRGPAAYGFQCILVANLDVSSYVASGRTLYIAFLAWRSSFTGLPTIYVDAVYINTINRRFYTIGFGNSIQGGRTGDSLASSIDYWSGSSWSTIASQYIGISYTLEYDYMSYVASSINFTSWFVYHWNQTILANATIPSGSRITPNRVGVGYWVSTTGVTGTVYFDNFVVTVDAPPWFVNVTGLFPGWYAVLKNSAGGLVANATAGVDGVAVLNVAPRLVDLLVDPNYRDGFIFPNGVIEVYDDNGRLVASTGPTLILGGDVYSLSLPSLRVLRVDSTLTNQPFQAKLTLTSLSGCSDTYLELYIVNTTNTYSTSIIIRWGIIGSQETSIIYMTPGTNNIAGYVEARRIYMPSGSTCNLTAWLQYTYSNWATQGLLRADISFKRS